MSARVLPPVSWLAIVFPLIGVAFWAYVCFWVTPDPAIILFLVALLPYAVCAQIIRRNQPHYGLSGAISALLGDGLMYHSVFIDPASSTSGFGLVLAPMMNLGFFVPLGLLVCYLTKRFLSRPKVDRTGPGAKER